MKKLLLTMLWPGMVCAHEPWTTLDKTLLATGATLHVVDWQQTRYIASHPQEFRELNPVLGSYPKQSAVNQYMLATLILFPLLADRFPEYRTLILGVWIGTRAAVVQNNYSIGVKLHW